MENLSPMLKQYLAMKQEVPENLLFFRLGDFYEVFFEDANVVAEELDLVLTARAAGNGQKAPMCGVPHHALHSYLQRLISKGYRVAIAEQMEDPSTAKGLVKREIVQIVTPGLNIDQDEQTISTLASVQADLLYYHVSIFNLTNNHEFQLTLSSDLEALILTLHQHHVREIICDDEELLKQLSSQPWAVTRHKVESKHSGAKLAYERLVSYLAFTQKKVVAPQTQSPSNTTLKIDYHSALNLELVESLRHRHKQNTLWDFLDETESSMGSRRLREWILNPLFDREKIEERQRKIVYLMDHFMVRHDVSKQLKQLADIYKLTTKIAYQSVSAQELIKLKESLRSFERIKELLREGPFAEVQKSPSSELLIQQLEDHLYEEPPVYIKDGQTIKAGVSSELDELRLLQADGRSWLLKYEQMEKERTGIKNLKVGYSRTFGYYIEVSKSQVSLVDESWGYKRRQTLTGGQRYVTATLQEQEDKLNHASDRIIELETALYQKLVQSLLVYTEMLDTLADVVSDVDVLVALSLISSRPGYVQPAFREDRSIDVVDSFHPILEKTLKSHEIISNDIVYKDFEDVVILTGPNMGGKSTYMRQVAICVIMAQMGCFIRAKQAEMPLFDAIYTRMGASDDILAGQSTFMVEMNEANAALSRATSQSLILFDEIGRGTSTYDGMALAKAIIEYLATHIKAKCIFSTHYHEITQLADELDNVVNMQVDVLEQKDKVTFLYRVKPGRAKQSYGIHVAQLAHLPYSLLSKARGYLRDYEDSATKFDGEVRVERVLPEFLNELEGVDVNHLSPIEAHGLLDRVIVALREFNDGED